MWKDRVSVVHSLVDGCLSYFHLFCDKVCHSLWFGFPGKLCMAASCLHLPRLATWKARETRMEPGRGAVELVYWSMPTREYVGLGEALCQGEGLNLASELPCHYRVFFFSCCG